MTLASFFSGIGGFDIGFARAGIPASVQCEIDENCRALLGKKFSALVLDDIRAIAAAHRRIREGKPGPDYAKWKRLFELLRAAVVWCGGFPCQDLSVAGARAGLDGERSGLWFAFRRLIALFRPTWVVIENVPGLLSSNGGGDFAVVLSGLEKLGYRWAYRVFDAQYAGLAQRRERVFVVASLGDYRCAEVLFERESVCWDTPPSREPREGSTGASEGGAAGVGVPELVGAITDGAHSVGGSTAKTPTPDEYLPSVAWALQERDAKGETYTHEGKNNFRLRNVVPVLEAGARTGTSTTDAKCGSGIGESGDPMFTLQRGKQHAVAVTPFDTTQITSKDNRSKPEPGDPSPTLAKGAHPPAIAFSGKDHGADATVDMSPTLRAMPHKDSHANDGGQVAVAFQPAFYANGRKRPSGAPSEIAHPLTSQTREGDRAPHVGGFIGVRRLTPKECERLQGFPDDWTAGFSDSVRYRMLGNAVAVPCAEWIAMRLVAVMKGEGA